MGLQKAEAPPCFAARTARDLMQKLKGALRRARIAVGETEIGIDNADEIELWKMMALGHELRANDDIELTFGDLVEFFAQAIDRFYEIARKDTSRRLKR
jgi:hypothetical protein